jgi:putative restriction endonuclease
VLTGSSPDFTNEVSFSLTPALPSFYARLEIAIVGCEDLAGIDQRHLTEPPSAGIVVAQWSEFGANAVRLELDSKHVDARTLSLLDAPVEEQERRIEQILVNRKIRDASFRRQVCDAYDNICAVTKFRIVNGGGKAEVQAAHIWPVAAGGPDVIQNGIALSGTAHWLFDRHLISLTDDYRLLVYRKSYKGYSLNN